MFIFCNFITWCGQGFLVRGKVLRGDRKSGFQPPRSKARNRINQWDISKLFHCRIFSNIHRKTHKLMWFVWIRDSPSKWWFFSDTLLSTAEAELCTPPINNPCPRNRPGTSNSCPDRTRLIYLELFFGVYRFWIVRWDRGTNRAHHHKL